MTRKSRPKKTITTVTEVVPDDLQMQTGDLIEAAALDEDETSEQELQSALAEIGDSEVTVQVVRTLPKEKAGHCARYSAQEFSVERVRDEYGGGTFILYFRLPNGQLKTKRRISIVERLQPPAVPDRTGEIIAALKDTSGGSKMMELIFTMIMAQQKSTSDMMTAILTRPVVQPQQLGVAEIIALLRGSKDGSESSAVDNLLKGIKLAKELGDGDGNGLASILGPIVGAATPLLERIGAPTATAPKSAPIPATARVVPPVQRSDGPRPMGAQPDSATTSMESQSSTAEVSATASGDNDVNLDLLIWLRQQLGVLIDRAERQKDPLLYADLLLDNLPAGITTEDIERHVSAPDALERLAMLDARVAQHQAWFIEFKDAILERIQEARPPVTDPVSVLYSDPNPAADTDE